MSSEKDCSAEQKIAALQERVKQLETSLGITEDWLREAEGLDRAVQKRPVVLPVTSVRCGGRTFKSTADLGLQCAECDSCGPKQTPTAAGAPTRKGPTSEGTPIQQRIAECRQQEIAIRTEAHLYMQNGPAGQHHIIRGQDDLDRAIKALLVAARRGKVIELDFWEVT